MAHGQHSHNETFLKMSPRLGSFLKWAPYPLAAHSQPIARRPLPARCPVGRIVMLSIQQRSGECSRASGLMPPPIRSGRLEWPPTQSSNGDHCVVFTTAKGLNVSRA